MEEIVTMIEEATAPAQEVVTQIVTQVVTEIVEVPVTNPEPQIQDMSSNIIHQLFLSLGVNLDYVPETPGEFFIMSLQFLAGLWFIYWFVKTMYKLLIGFMTPGGRLQ